MLFSNKNYKIYFDLQPKVNIYRSLERQAGEKFQDNIVELLIAAGYDSKTAIKSFSNSSTFIQIESYINENRDRFKTILKCTKYENLEPFKFLPGHTALLSGLPEYMIQLNKNKRNLNKKSNKQQFTVQNEVEKQTMSELPNGSEKQSTNQQINELVELNNIENSIDQKKVVENLIKRITKFAEKNNIVVDLSENHILNFRSEENKIKCSFECPFCQKKIPCNYVTNWSCGNVQSHLKNMPI